MRPERDIELILDAWLASGPVEMPDRLYDDVLRRIERVPQSRHARATSRFTTMPSGLKLPLAAAVAALIIGLVSTTSWTLNPDSNLAPGSTTETSPSPELELPAALLAGWAGPPRTIPEMATWDEVALWNIRDAAEVLLRVESADLSLMSKVDVVGPDRLRLTSVAGSYGCPKQTMGTYDWSLSDDGSQLSLSVVDEACPMRADFLAGTWSRMACDLGAPCRGPLAAGPHESAIFDPRNGSADVPRGRQGGVTYDVPMGWANDWDYLSSMRLVPLEAYQALEAAAAYPPDASPDQVSLWSRPVGLVVDPDDCRWYEDSDAGSSVDSLASWLSAHPELTSSEPVATQVGDHRAVQMDIDLASGAGTTCDGLDGSPVVPLLASRDGIGDGGALIEWTEGGWAVDGWDLASVGTCPGCTSDPKRIMLVDLDGEPLVVLIDSEQPEGQAALIERAMPIVESFEFPE